MKKRNRTQVFYSKNRGGLTKNHQLQTKAQLRAKRRYEQERDNARWRAVGKLIVTVLVNDASFWEQIISSVSVVHARKIYRLLATIKNFDMETDKRKRILEILNCALQTHKQPTGTPDEQSRESSLGDGQRTNSLPSSEETTRPTPQGRSQ